ncbi:NAD(P)/FAD-dependent oxidoreductase [Kitasatospora xanthocidica]|uniref:NAD(P)/FAD-dependent oxidoreductase n=1 Tax=Kitasatospora xanthocidica TaxID=83382 RepID=UPI0036E47BF2
MNPADPAGTTGTAGTAEPYDVIIVGTGLSGTMLGSILARHGFRTLLLDGAQHPRFAIGESTIGQTLALLRLIAQRYDVPEIGYLASFPDTIKHVGSSHGQKTNFGFQIHQDGREPDPSQSNQLRIPEVIGYAAHYFRQDTDAYMFHTAVRYGCDARQNFRVERLDLRKDGVSVAGADGTVHEGRYLVDASGFRSPLAHQEDLREVPTRLKHQARSIFTHFIGVQPYDDHIDVPVGERPPVRWNDGTMHHIFDRGWMWVIPFDNHENATNQLCSVGIQIDPRMYPERSDLTPEEEFWLHVRRFPAVERHLAGARPVREWVRTGRMQYSSSRTVGDRWCLMSHAAGFLDPLFSRGLANTCEIINTLSWRLMDALREDDFAPERFEYVERLEQGLLDYNDQLVNSSFIAFADHRLWDCVFRLWGSASILGGRRLATAIARTVATGDDAHCRALDDDRYPGLWCPTDFYHELFTELVEVCERVEAGGISSEEAARRMRRRIQESDWMLPALGFTDPGTRFIDPTPARMREVGEWARTHPSKELREYLAIGHRELD